MDYPAFGSEWQNYQTKEKEFYKNVFSEKNYLYVPKMTKADYDVLGQIINTTFGVSSQTSLENVWLSFFVTGQDEMQAKYHSILRFKNTSRSHDEDDLKLADEKKQADRMIKERLKLYKAQFKKLTGKTLKTKMKEKDPDPIIQVTETEHLNAQPKVIFKVIYVFELIV